MYEGCRTLGIGLDSGLPHTIRVVVSDDTVQGTCMIEKSLIKLRCQDKVQKKQAVENLGLFAYPVLMAADILLYRCLFRLRERTTDCVCRATHVPVGDDQLQHLELAKEVSRLFHNRYQSDLFPVPEPMLSARVMDEGSDLTSL